MPVTFDHPAQLLWLAAAALLVAARLDVGRRARQPVSSLSLWDEAMAMRRRSRWGTGALLAAQLVTVVAAALALAAPRWRLAGEEERRLALVLDGSASMQARQDEAVRFDLARRALKQVIDSMQPGDQAMLLWAGPTPRPLCRWTSDRRKLRAALDEAAPSEAPADTAAAVEIARMVASAAGARGAAYVASDGCFEGAAAFSQEEQVRFLRLAEPQDAAAVANFAITRLAARPVSNTPHKCLVLVEAASFGSQPESVPVTLEAGGKKAAQFTLALAPGERQEKVVPLDLKRPASITARLEIDDALAHDNKAQAQATPWPLVEIRLHGEVYPPLEAALRAMPLGRLGSGDVPADHVVTIYHQDAPPQLPPGPALVIDPQRNTDLWTVAAPASNIGQVRSSHPGGPLQDIAWELVIFDSAAQLRFNRPAQTLAADERGQPMVTLVERPEGNVLVLHAQLEQSDLRLHPAFGAFLRQTVHWLADIDPSGEAPRSDFQLASVRESDLRPDDAITWSSPPPPAQSRPFSSSLALALVGLMIASLALEPIVERLSATRDRDQRR